MSILTIAQSTAPYVFGGAGVFALYTIANEIKGHVWAIQELLADYRLIQGALAKDIAAIKESAVGPSLAFEQVMCGGCGQTVPTGDDGFSPAPHDCDPRAFENNFQNSLNIDW